MQPAGWPARAAAEHVSRVQLRRIASARACTPGRQLRMSRKRRRKTYERRTNDGMEMEKGAPAALGAQPLQPREVPGGRRAYLMRSAVIPTRRRVLHS